MKRMIPALALAALLASQALAAPAPARPDPKDAQIGQLQSRLTEAKALIAALRMQRGQCEATIRDGEAAATAQQLLSQAAKQDPAAAPKH